MTHPKIKEANRLYREGDFEGALQIYQSALNDYPKNSLLANIYLCEKALNIISKTFETAIDAKHAISSQNIISSPAEEDIFLKNKNTITDKISLQYLKKSEPHVFKASVIGKGMISIHPIIYTDIYNDAQPALFAVRFLKADKSELQFDHPDCSHSNLFNNYRYLKSGKNTINLIIPEDCSYIEGTIFPWMAKKSVQLQTPVAFELTTQSAAKRLTKWSSSSFSLPPVTQQDHLPTAVSILDEFSEMAFAYDLNLLAITPENWREKLSKANPRILFVESAWKGNAGAWQYALTNPRNAKHTQLVELVRECQRLKIPTVFWNKEDPPNFNTFIDSAKYFDYIFTTDFNCIDKYKEVCGHDRVYALPFAAQPKIHNPIGKIERSGCDVAFAGTWYAKKHKERSVLAPLLFDAAIDKGLTIFNRMSDWKHDDSYDFPSKYKSFVNPKISYHEMLSVHKLFKVFLNVNSVIDSPTMFSRRIYEVLASSTPVISTESVGVERFFKSIVPVVKSSTEASDALVKLLKDDLYRKKIGHLGYREVMQNHTISDRIQFIFEKLGTVYDQAKRPKVTWAVPTNRPAHLKYIIENFNRQDYSNIELIVALNSDEFNKREVESAFNQDHRVKVIQLPEKSTLGEVLNATIDEMTGEYWMKIDDDNIYLRNFTSDMLLPFQYANVNIVGKGSYFTYLEESDEMIIRFPGQEHKYVTFCSGSALAVKREVFNNGRFPPQSVGEDTIWMKECIARGEQIYSPDIFNYIVVRRKDLSTHTWQANSETIKKNSVKVSTGLRLDIVSA